jgi:hypothetical protein
MRKWGFPGKISWGAPSLKVSIKEGCDTARCEEFLDGNYRRSVDTVVA